MNAPLTVYRARKGRIVYLQQDLPLGFGNRNPIPRQTGIEGCIESDGFENGIIRVVFQRHYTGIEHTFFNPDAALKYLECDAIFPY